MKGFLIAGGVAVGVFLLLNMQRRGLQVQQVGNWSMLQSVDGEPIDHLKGIYL